MSLLTESFLPEEDHQIRRPRVASVARANTINMRDYHTSGVQFERITMKMRDGPLKRNIFTSSAIHE
jgi:hypothetical protein